MRRLIWCWLKGPLALRCRVSAAMAANISTCLQSCRSFIPCAFNRKPRSLSEYERWKATEFRQFALYTGMVVLKQNLNDEFYEHFMLFVVAVFCLTSPVHIGTHCDYAGKLLARFVRDWSKY